MRVTLLRRAAIGLAAVLWLCRSVAAQDVPLSPYVVDHFARQDSPADVRFLLDAPAGKHGFVRVRDGHLYTDDGRRFRMWGVNLTGWTRGFGAVAAAQGCRGGGSGTGADGRELRAISVSRSAG